MVGVVGDRGVGSEVGGERVEGGEEWGGWWWAVGVCKCVAPFMEG